MLSNPCVGPSTRIKIPSFLLLTCTDELLSAPKILTFFQKVFYVNKNSER